MYFTNFTEFRNYIIDCSFKEPSSHFILLDNSVEIERLLIQTMKRTIENQEIEFVAIRDIKIREQYQGKGLFKDILKLLIDKNVPILVDDIVNQDLDKHLEAKGFKSLIYNKSGESIRARFIF